MNNNFFQIASVIMIFFVMPVLIFLGYKNKAYAEVNSTEVIQTQENPQENAPMSTDCHDAEDRPNLEISPEEELMPEMQPTLEIIPEITPEIQPKPERRPIFRPQPQPRPIFRPQPQQGCGNPYCPNCGGR